jgi:hypothetical protein
MANLTQIVDVAPITVGKGDAFSTKVFRRHLPAIYFAHSLEMLRDEDVIIAPVIDVVERGRFSELEEGIVSEFTRRTGIADLRIIDESQRKMPEDPKIIAQYVEFLNGLGIDLSSLDRSCGLVYDKNKVAGFNNNRLHCTIAELLVYHDKLELVDSGEGKVILLTGYDESYDGMYGVGSNFREKTEELATKLSDLSRKEVEIVSFVYALNPKGVNPVELTRDYRDFSSDEQEEVVLRNALFTLASAYLFSVGKAPSNFKDLRMECNASQRLKDMKRLLAENPLEDQTNFDYLAEQAYQLLQ